jgi:RNA 2',3'-cyclic 3'-phosphodiesterase
VRLFLAIELDDSLLSGLEAMQARLQEGAPNAEVRWPSRENFHLTVLYLGERGDDQLPAIQDMCGTIASETKDFRIRLAGGSAFPKPATGKPLKTLWVGLTEGAERWKELALRAEPWFTPLGAPKSDGLVPHVTLGRVKAEGAALHAALEAEKSAEIGAQQAIGLSLIESVLTPQGATYTRRGRWEFSPK